MSAIAIDFHFPSDRFIQGYRFSTGNEAYQFMELLAPEEGEDEVNPLEQYLTLEGWEVELEDGTTEDMLWVTVDLLHLSASPGLNVDLLELLSEFESMGILNNEQIVRVQQRLFPNSGFMN